MDLHPDITLLRIFDSIVQNIGDQSRDQHTGDRFFHTAYSAGKQGTADGYRGGDLIGYRSLYEVDDSAGDRDLEELPENAGAQNEKEDDKEESDLTFPDFFDEQGKIDENVVKQFIDHVIKDEKTENRAE